MKQTLCILSGPGSDPAEPDNGPARLNSSLTDALRNRLFVGVFCNRLILCE
jgi:hypothetical protein